jgi:N-acetylmuramoyl-L-alanine amidase
MKKTHLVNPIKSINYFSFFLMVSLLLGTANYAQQITGLSGWNIFLDPGHSQKENMGIYNYSEADKNLGVALNLRQMLLDWTDIDTVYICRTNDQVQVSLTQRTDLANSLGAAHYHSIHSDATTMGSSVNSTLSMWGQLGINGPEKSPAGGKKMSDIMIGLLTAGMRTNTRGSMGDRTFYGVDGSTPYLHVNRETNMASELSEAGFHTSPTQNQLNMNASWKRLEAKTMFWTILKYHNITRPFVGTVVGIIKDLESGLAINGAAVTLNGQTDTTDTWQSLFYQYSSDSSLLRNGFYYFEDVPAGTYPLHVTIPGYEPYISDVTIADTFFTFKDVGLISNLPPTVVSTTPANNDSLYPGVENLVIYFSRPMNRSSVESNILISPVDTVTYSWSNGDKTLTINTSQLDFESQYEVTIQGNAEDKYSHTFDGDKNGIGGDSYSFLITTKAADITAPTIVEVYPAETSSNIELKPVINISFDEALKTSTISSRFKIVRNSTQTNVAGTLKHYVVNGRSVLNAFISGSLVENETYTINLASGIEDIFGNPIPVDNNFEFTTGNSNYISQSIIDNFDSGIGNWWQPTASGSTKGVIPQSTKITSVNTVLNHNTGSTKSMMLEYAYNLNESDWLIREYRSLASPSFDANTILQAFVFGDGTNNKFRFALKETSLNSYEVSPWLNLDWIGWKLISWDLTQGQTGSWIGNGILEPPFIFDSFQFTYNPGNQSIGTLYLDDLRTASFQPTDVQEENGLVPTQYSLEQNYPNPFNPSTQIKFSIPEASDVKVIVSDMLGREIAIVVNGHLNPGNYTTKFNTLDFGGLSSGVYLYTLITDNFKQSKKMILLK